MDEQTVSQKAEAHAKATVAGDLKSAGSVLDKSAYGPAGEVMKKMPGDLSGCEITSASQQGDGWLVTIRYTGTEGSVDVESTWAERDGEPKIVGLQVL